MSAVLAQRIEYVYVAPKHGMTSPQEDSMNLIEIIKKIENDSMPCDGLRIVMNDVSNPNSIFLSIVIDELKIYVSDKKFKKLKQIEVCSNMQELPVIVY